MRIKAFLLILALLGVGCSREITRYPSPDGRYTIIISYPHGRPTDPNIYLTLVDKTGSRLIIDNKEVGTNEDVYEVYPQVKWSSDSRAFTYTKKIGRRQFISRTVQIINDHEKISYRSLKWTEHY